MLTPYTKENVALFFSYFHAKIGAFLVVDTMILLNNFTLHNLKTTVEAFLIGIDDQYAYIYIN